MTLILAHIDDALSDNVLFVLVLILAVVFQAAVAMAWALSDMRRSRKGWLQ